MPNEARVKCPICGRYLSIPFGQTEAECICHLYCSEGDKPSDCVVTEVNYSGQLGFPVGLHNDNENEGDDVMHRVRYCSTHDKYIYKTPVIVELPKDFYKERLPVSQRKRVRG